MNIKRLYEYDPLTQQVMGKVFNKIKDEPKDGKLRHFSGLVRFNGNIYHIEFDFVFKHQYLQVGEVTTKLHDRNLIHTGVTLN